MTIRKDIHRVFRYEQPISWGRAIAVGMLAACCMMAFIDTYSMLGLTGFTMERYVGTLFYGDTYAQRAWLVGFIANLGIGGLFGVLYGYFFEYSFYRASARNGIFVGLIHTAVASVTVFPFVTLIHQLLGHEEFARLGWLGTGDSAVAPILILVGHLLFGMTMGVLYGPVRQDRIRARDFEPGDMGRPGELGVLTATEDPVDSRAVYKTG